MCSWAELCPGNYNKRVIEDECIVQTNEDSRVAHAEERCVFADLGIQHARARMDDTSCNEESEEDEE